MASLTTAITSTAAPTAAAASVEPAAPAAPATAAAGDAAAPGSALGGGAHFDTPMSFTSRRRGHAAAARLTRAADQVSRASAPTPVLSQEGGNG